MKQHKANRSTERHVL